MPVPYDYDPIIDRPQLKWPNGARLAFWITPNIEVFRLGMPVTAQGVMTPSVSAYAARDYGNRVAIWRVMDILKRYGIRASVALNSEICERTPRIIEEGNKLGWEWMGHGRTNSILLPDMNEQQQAEHVRETVEMIRKGSGKAPRGWLSAGLAEGEKTLDHLVQNGVDYVCDWVADDQPFWMRTDSGPLVGMPYGQVNDISVFSDRGRDPAIWVKLVQTTFDTLYAEGTTQGKLLALSVHPFIIGQPHLIAALDESLAYVSRHEGVWFATGSEIVDHFKEARPQPK
ncbi:MAG TPA: polysaccharide deacetylase family protein [Dehalococcoidia bacterium]